ncbi:dTDP-4-dehydrorhamnose 3,5-epimerase [Alkaliphilus serpentinus]|uniref:dTDP-4-dehydrorhamnose 3,5-epimerase n=1 Tax=Alkaliphilus serpentinus TaxID=1482731 RepID=A0A833M916_9FIRM|nr:dTDP-4-dehydrorhamnose 3,5-epimerase [Alkaliphilus serpentinus]KAB3526633.1 dTDP-4-dehydrorhamnose 3,5-epimerase [Alkaliphilus serpentinus]
MSNFHFNETGIKGLYVIQQKIYADSRGYFMETYNEKAFLEAGLNVKFVQDNQSKSTKGVLRGLHFQKQYPQGKLVRIIKGEVFDVAVDLRRNSPTFKQWFGCILSEENRRQMYLPEGFAHGFLVLSNEAEFIYKCTNLYHPEDEGGYLWNDPTFHIQWPLEGIKEVILSEKDKSHLPFNTVEFSYNF